MILIKNTVDILFDFSLVINALVLIPQLIKVIRLKTTEELSFSSFFCMFLLQLIFALHGYFHNDHPLMWGMFAAMLISGTLSCLIIIYRK